MLDLLGSCGLGLLLGLRHALEPDHMAAVSTLVVQSSRPWRAAILGAWWGLGHTLALVTVGMTLGLLHVQMPRRLADGFELVVAVMLIGLGLQTLFATARKQYRGLEQEHQHRHERHAHPGPAAHVHLGHRVIALRPALVGLVHGLAGSGALTALALSRMPTLRTGIFYMVLFGLGSLAGMSILTGLAGWPLLRAARSQGLRAGLSLASGGFAVILGLIWGWPLVFTLGAP